jgi:hypothetical protein
MKNPNQERLGRLMRQYHRHNPWPLQNGFFIPHLDPNSGKLSWWDDIGFILNGHRIMVWWVHPRMKYADAINELAWKEAGDSPARAADMFVSGEKQWKKVGRSRKKVASYLCQPMPDSQQDYYAKLDAIESRMESEGIDFSVRPSISVKRLAWCSGVEFCLPADARTATEVRALAGLAKRLLKGETTLSREFPAYEYGRAEWLAEAEMRKQDRQQSGGGDAS